MEKNNTQPSVGQVWRSNLFSAQFVDIVEVNDVSVKYKIHGDVYSNELGYFCAQYRYSHDSRRK